jgi:hypothetical protein
MAWPPHEDETLALFVGRQSLGRLLDIVLEERGGAPLHYLIAAVAAHSGGGLTALRLASALFALASIPTVAYLLARLAGRGPALVATVLVSASWVLLFHGVYGRMYSLFLFTSALSYLALLWSLDHGRVWRFALYALVAVACVASHPYGALVVASQGVFVLLVRRRLALALASLTAIGFLGIPFWLADLRLANRFDVGVAGADSGKLGAPLPVLRYLKDVAGDFTAGWTTLLVPLLLLAAYGFLQLWRRNREAATLAACVIGTPTVAMLVARLGAGASPAAKPPRAGSPRPRSRTTSTSGTSPSTSRRGSTIRPSRTSSSRAPTRSARQRGTTHCGGRSAEASGSSTATTRTTARARGRSRSRSDSRIPRATTRRACSARTWSSARRSRRGRPPSTSTTRRRS